MEAVPSAYSDNASDNSMTPRLGTIQAAALFDSQHVSGVLQHLPSSTDTCESSSSTALHTISASIAAVQSGQPQISQNRLPEQSPSTGSFQTPMLRSAASRFKMIDFGLADFRETYGAGYVTEKHDTLVHRQPHRQPSLQSLLCTTTSNNSNNDNRGSAISSIAAEERRQAQDECSTSSQTSRIKWISDDKPDRRASRKFFPVPAALLPEVCCGSRSYCRFRSL